MIETNFLLEWAGALIGIMGAALLATNSRFSKYGWWCFLAANVLLIAWALRIGAMGLLVQQVCFTVTSLLGIARSGVSPVIYVKKTESSGVA